MSNLREQVANLSSEQRERLRALLAQKAAPAQPEKTYPLSHSQWVMWFASQLAPESPAYNVAFAVQIHSAVAPQRLADSLEWLVQRHAALRTTCSASDDHPLQRVHDELGIDFRCIQLGSADERELRRQLRSFCQEPFDLEHGPALRAALYSVSAAEHILLLVAHHVSVDLWSIRILFDELPVVYGALAENRRPTLANARAEYADFVRWQKEYLSTPEAEASLQYWKGHLANPPASLDLPQDYPRPPMQNLRGRSHLFTIGAETTDRLRKLAAEHGVTLYAALLTAFQTVIHFLTGSNDILVGSPVSGRTLPQFDAVVGCFINFVVFRGDLSDDPTFERLLSRLFAAVMAGLEHQAYPFSALTERLGIARDASRAPLTGIGFSLDRVAVKNASAELAFDAFPFLEQQEGQFDLFLEMGDRGDILTAALRFNTDIYADSTAAGWMEDFLWVIEEAIRDPQRRVSELREARRERQRRQCTAPQQPYPREWRAHQLFEQQVERRGEAIAVQCGSRQMTYAALNNAANRIARLLAAHGVGPECIAPLWERRGLSFLAAILGVWKAGGAFLPLDLHAPAARQRQTLQQSGARIVLAGHAFREQAREACQDAGVSLVEIPSIEEDGIEEERNFAVPSHERHLAYVIFTSGSTGEPKGVMIEHRGMMNHLWAKVQDLHLDTGDVLAQTASQCFDISVWQFVAPLLAGGRVVVIPDEMVHEPAQLIQELIAAQVTVLETVPSLLWALLEEIEAGQTAAQLKLRTLISTGEALTPELVQRCFDALPNVQMVNAYGPTECSDDVTHHFLRKAPEQRRHVPLGRALANTQLYVLDEAMELAPAGSPGELYVGGEGVGRGYLNKGGLTAAAFVPDPFSGRAGARLYRTGDRVRQAPGGELEFLGRIDRQVKLRGFRLELGEIEAVLREHERLEWASVLVREGPGKNPLLVAYVKGRKQEAAPDARELRDYVARRLPHYMTPSFFVELDEIPVTRNGKLDTKNLPLPDQVPPGDSGRPETPLEQQLARLWEAALGRDRIGLQDDFFELGGDSITAIQIVNRARRENLPIAARDVYSHPTVASLAEHLSMTAIREPERSPSSAGKEPASVFPLSPMQEGLLFHSRYAPETNMYVVQLRLSVGGNLIPAEMRDRWRSAMQRHGVLRTSFHEDGPGDPFQRVHPSADLPWRYFDWREKSARQQQAAFSRYAAQDRAGRFRLDEAPLFRVTVMRTGPDRHEALFTFHHLILDGWSAALLIQEVFSAIASADSASVEPPPYCAYVDFLQTQDLSAAERFWRDYLAGFSAPTPIGANSSASSRALGEGRHEDRTLVLTPKATAALQSFAGRQRLTLQTIIRGAWALVLAQRAAQRDVVFGTTVSGRSAPLKGVDQMIGLLINTVPVRVRFQPQDDLLPWLRGLQESELEAREFEHTPLQKIQAWSEIPRNSTLFQSNLVFENYPLQRPTEAPSARLRISGTRIYERGNYPLTFVVIPGERLLLQMSYDSRAFAAEEITGMLKSCRSLLQAIVRHPDSSVSDLRQALDPDGRPSPADVSAPANESAPIPAPGRSAEQRVAALWAEALGRQAVGRDQNFFELGGDSITAMRLVSRINRALNRSIPIRVLFEHPTLAGFEKRLQALQAATPEEN